LPNTPGYFPVILDPELRERVYDRFPHESRTGRGKIPLEVGQPKNCLGRVLAFVRRHAAILQDFETGSLGRSVRPLLKDTSQE
jgi:hypothetical protein